MRKCLRLLGRVLLAVVIAAALVVAAFFFLRWRGLLLFPQEADPRQWPVFGVDVSSYQGDIQWPILAEQGVDFAFIKATEGSGMQDRYFAQNWAGAQGAGIRVGAYHFFSYDSPGESQAENFIAQVPVTEGALPPVVDLEFYGSYLREPKEAGEVVPILDTLLERLEAAYGVKPILYVTYRSYRLYVRDRYDDYPLWVSSPMVAPLVTDWSFWQYSHSAELAGYRGSEGRIDLNVFQGTRAEFEEF